MGTCEMAINSRSGDRPSLTQKLTTRRDRLEQELALAKRAEQLLSENPALRELFDIVSQVQGL